MSITMDFSDALRLLKAGGRLRREAWGTDQWLAVSCPAARRVPAEGFWSEHNRAYAERCGGTAVVLPSLTAKMPDGGVQMGWAPTQADLFAQDWVAV